MKITDALKQELAQWIETYWTTYLKGDVETWATMLKDDYRNIGGTKEEIWNSKQEIVDYTYRILDQMLGAVEFRNRKIDIIPYGSHVMLHEFTDIYLKVEGEWILYGPFRMSSLLEKTEKGWMALHQHGSYPDMKSMEGEAFSMDALKAENERLQEAVKNRTIELEIEAALERVRSTAMGMKKPDDMLDVCRVIAAQLQQFGVNNIRNVQTAIIDENIGQYLCYQYFPAYEQTTIEDTQYHKSPVENEMVRQMLLSRDGHFIGSLKGKELDKFRNHRKAENQFSDPLLEEASEVSYCFLSIGEGGLGLSLYHNMEQKDLTLFGRFHQVFNLAYQKFRDIRKAEAQVREAQIEAALERVRAASMAMMDSSALSVIIYKLYAELTKLDAKLDRAFIMIVNPENKGITWWLAGKEGLLAENGFFIQKNQHSSHLMYLEKWENRTKKWQYLFEGKEKKDWDRFGFSETELARLPDFIKEDMAAVKSVYLSGSSDQFGSLVTGSFEPMPEEQQNILSRFAVVFNQTYIRFLDLQKAEAQAREAQIEVAVERVRAQSMAMHHPDDLDKVNKEILTQLNWLQIQGLSGVTFYLVDQDGWVKAWDFSSPGNIGNQNSYTLQFDFKKYEMMGYPFKIFEQTDLNYLVADYPLEKLEKAVFEIEEINPEVATVVKEALATGILTHQWSACTRITDGLLAIDLVSPPSEDTKTIVLKIAGAFNQAYQRFLDLQKAQAQAREAQVEASMERVRAHAMGLRKSEDLENIIAVIFEELQKLGLDLYECSIFLRKGTSREFTVWGKSTASDDFLANYQFIFLDHPILNEVLRDLDRKIPYREFSLEQEDIKSYGDLIFSQTDLKNASDEYKESFYALKKVFAGQALFQHGILEAVGMEPLPGDLPEVLQRFTQVIDLTYTRFLDLQKAELQAREAQIEAALERVRSRTMAMHKSEQLPETAQVLFEQFAELGKMPDRISIGIINEELQGIEWWVTDQMGSLLARHFDSSILQPTIGEIFTAWKEGKESIMVDLSGDALKEWVAYVRDVVKMPINDSKMKGRRVHHGAFFSQGLLLISAHEPMPNETLQLLVRFAKVFSQTYTRFLDLQKAEAQAREAQIEAALERVRSRSMGMQKSGELRDVIQVIYEQFVQLGLNIWTAGFFVDIKESNDWNLWAADSGHWYPTKIHIPYFDHPIFHRFVEAKAKGLDVYAYSVNYQSDEKNKIVEHWINQIEIPEELKAFAYNQPAWNVSNVIMKNVGLYIFNWKLTPFSDDDNAILLRFAIVFEQTYTRFLDLQKAEAQAREAQIETALERVRSRSLAMHKSDELNEVVSVLFEKLKELQIPFTAVGIAISIEGSKDLNAFVCGENEAGLVITNYRLPYFDNKICNDFNHVLEHQIAYFVGHYAKEEKDAFYNYLLEHTPEFSHLPDDVKRIIFNSESYTVSMIAVNKATFNINDFEGKVLADNEIDIIKRFARVFDQAYTRFLDLQKAEAQAREARIEAALEKVRSRTMAMQNSGDLNGAAAEMFKEIQSLGMQPWGCGFNIFDSDEKAVTQYMSLADGGISPPFRTPLTEDPFFIEIFNARQRKDELLVMESAGESLAETYRYMFGLPGSGEIFGDLENAGFEMPKYQITHCAYFPQGYLVFITYQQVTEAHNIFRRFAQVFDQTYTRFLDLKKAEAQAREAQIEAALERIRSKSLAMFRTDDIGEVVGVLFEQMQGLSVDMGFASVSIFIFHEGSRELTQWIQLPEGVASLHIPYLDHPISSDLFDAKESGVDYFARAYSKEEKNTWLLQGFELTDYKSLPEDFKTSLLNAPGYAMSIALAKYSGICIPSFVGQYPSAENVEIMKRVSKVFDQTYTRFLDLQKAEAQAREAQIEVALERIRARALAMHKSDEFTEVAKVMREQMGLLGQPELETSAVHLYDEDPDYILSWRAFRLSSDLVGEISFGFFRIPKNSCAIARTFVQKFKSIASAYSMEVSGAEQTEWYKILFKLAPEVHEAMKKSGTTKEKRYYHFSKFTGGALLMVTSKEPATDTMELQKRSALVFDLAYRRFKDLQKAEAQAREGQIEAALEKVRSRSLAMQKPGELTEVAELLRKEMGQLSVEELETSSIYIVDKENKQAECWYAIKDIREENKQLISDEMTITFADTWVGSEMGKFYRAKKAHSSIVMKGDNRKEWINYCAGKSKVLQGYYGDEIPERTYHLVKFNGGYMGAASPGAISAESWDLLRRAASVFSLAYTRFKDLQDAAEREREAQIELALERVRSKTMAMHNSQDVGESVATLFDELTVLGVLTSSDRCGIGIMQPEEMMELWTAEKVSGTTALTIGHLDMSHHILLKNVYQNWLDKKETYQYVLEGEDKLQYYEAIRNQSNYKIKNDYYSAYEKIVHTDFYFKEGCLYVFSLNGISDESTKVFIRFASVFGQTYRRYLDLQNAEVLALDTLKRSSVDRVRAEIASMRTLKDLDRITPLIWRELTILGIPFIRCGVFIMNENKHEVHSFLSKPDGNALASFHLPYDATEQTKQIVAHWHQKQLFKDHMDGAAFIEYTKNLIHMGAVGSEEKYVTENLPTDLYLHFLPFLQGMLYVGNDTLLNEGALELVQNLADAFSTAYARYEDFSKLEAAKAIVESAMNELKDTQNQLVQQEKLASLGQLTAGIAHEIKNPLNFVNNFSEVSMEMIDELKEERSKSPESRDEGMIDDILEDIRSNLKKVHEHGTRANGIVNSMLQHSRGGTGKKEETDLNVLIKEYVNLSFHGMRAGKTPINVDIVLDLDSNLKAIPLIKEDFTRVIINLCNNAFDAMRSKTLTNQYDNYLPKLTVVSKKDEKNITITVRDNGPGIPNDIKDKILQPFFTTKKGTEGTGLGLSITNDIIKAHGGELTIESQVGEGTAFIIQIPVV